MYRCSVVPLFGCTTCNKCTVPAEDRSVLYHFFCKTKCFIRICLFESFWSFVTISRFVCIVFDDWVFVFALVRPVFTSVYDEFVQVCAWCRTHISVVSVIGFWYGSAIQCLKTQPSFPLSFLSFLPFIHFGLHKLTLHFLSIVRFLLYYNNDTCLLDSAFRSTSLIYIYILFCFLYV